MLFNMSRKLILSFAAIATLAFAALASGAADAKPIKGHAHVKGHGHGHGIVRIHRPHFHKHVRIHRVYERAYIRPVAYVRPVVEGPCTCLTKGYTPEGAVVFKDLCTKEMASAPAEGAPAQASEVQSPSNFAGKTYQDYLAANPQNQTAQQKN